MHVGAPQAEQTAAVEQERQIAALTADLAVAKTAAQIAAVEQGRQILPSLSLTADLAAARARAPEAAAPPRRQVSLEGPGAVLDALRGDLPTLLREAGFAVSVVGGDCVVDTADRAALVEAPAGGGELFCGAQVT